MTVDKSDILSKEEAIMKLEGLPKEIYSRLKGKILHDIESMIGEKVLDKDGNQSKLPNGRLLYKETPLLTSTKQIVTSRISKVANDVRELIDAIMVALELKTESNAEHITQS